VIENFQYKIHEFKINELINAIKEKDNQIQKNIENKPNPLLSNSEINDLEVQENI